MTFSGSPLMVAPRLARAGVGVALGLATAARGAVPEVLGDLDGDGRHTVRDVVKIVNHLQAIEFLPGDVQAFADVNEDGLLNRADVEFLIEVILANETLETLPRTVPLETSPVNGEGAVALTREAVVRFSLPLAETTVLGPAQFKAEFAGREILSRVELSGDRMKATLFFLEHLPASARVRVTLRGEGLRDYLDRPLDLDRNGQPGGNLVYDFETVSVSAVPRTGVVGTVFAAEKNPDGSNIPLQGVIIEVVGAEETLRTTTRADGAFFLHPVPAGQFFVTIDGRPLTGAYPDGAYYPFVGKAWRARAGRMDNLAGETGTVYLPLVSSGTLQPTSPIEETVIEFPSALTAAQPALAGTLVRVPPNALFANDGTRGGRVGIAPVPPDRLPSPLPPGFSTPLVITIQTDGATNFDQPVPVRFPNLVDPATGVRLPAGAASTLWSFDHDVGDWEVAGPMVVTDDGQFLVTAPGVGVRQPGWHFPAPPAVQGGGGGPAPFPPTPGDTVAGNGGPGNDGLPEDNDPGNPDNGEGNGNGGGGSDGPLLGGPGSDYGPGYEGCTFSHIIDAGMLVPGTVQHVGPATSPAGVAISFVSDGARDTGGREGINCPGGPGEIDIPPGPIDYTWIITHNGRLVSQGFGLNASVAGNVTGATPAPGEVGGAGTYQVEFFALPRRYAIRDEVVSLGVSFVNVVPSDKWIVSQVETDVSALVPGVFITIIEEAISLIPGVEVELDREATSLTVENGVRNCLDPFSGQVVAEGEVYNKGTVKLSATIDGPLWPGFGYVEKIRRNGFFGEIVLDFKAGATIAAEIAIAATVGDRRDDCRGVDCGFGDATVGFGVTGNLGFEFEGFVVVWGRLFQIGKATFSGINASLGVAGTVGYNTADECWSGLNYNITIGEMKWILLSAGLPTPAGTIKFGGYQLIAFKAIEFKGSQNQDPLGNPP